MKTDSKIALMHCILKVVKLLFKMG